MAYQNAKAAKIEERLAHRACVGLVAHVMHVEDTAEIPRAALAEDELHGRGLKLAKNKGGRHRRERMGVRGDGREEEKKERKSSIPAMSLPCILIIHSINIATYHVLYF